MSLGSWGRNSRKGRKRRRLVREKLGPNRYNYSHDGQYERRLKHLAGRRATPQEARLALHDYLHAHYHDVPGIVRYVDGRYHMVFVGFQGGRSSMEGDTYHFVILPRGGRLYTGRNMPPDGPARSITDRVRHLPSYSTHDTAVKVYETPRGAHAEFPRTMTWAYRGMSYEEFTLAMQRGWFASQGAYNIIGQGEAVTFFSKDPATARHYATSFQAWPFHATHTRPGVVIAVPRYILEDYYGVSITPEKRAAIAAEQRKHYPHSGEMTFTGKLSLDHVRAAWYLTPTYMRSGVLDVSRAHQPFRTETGALEWREVVMEGSRNAPDGRYVAIPVPEFDSGGLAGSRHGA